MAPQDEAATANASTTSSTEDTSGQEQQNGQQQAPTPGTGGNGEQQQAQAPVIDKSTQLPDDHPLVVNHAEVKQKLARQTTELTEARAQAARVTKLEEDLAARPTPEALETLQTRYDRLEAFAQAVGLGKALDSRTFTRDLFETDKDIQSLVKEFNKANPSATSQALGAAGGGEGSSKPDQNALLRAAAGR